MNLELLQSLRIPVVEQQYAFKDSILYALGLGYGEDPLDPAQLQFVYEERQQAVPSMCVVLGYPGFWLRDAVLGVDWVRMLHAEHSFTLHRPLKPAGSVRSEHSITAVVDKGAGKGALLYVEKKLFDEQGPLATILQTLFLRGDGGCGSFGAPPAALAATPEREPDLVAQVRTSPRAALIYRLSGDFNPVHADPAVAKAAGFDRPILMGLCTMGIATRAAVQHLCGGNPERLRSLAVRFSKPVFPGETIEFRFYRSAEGAQFVARSVERDITVLERCQITVG